MTNAFERCFGDYSILMFFLSLQKAQEHNRPKEFAKLLESVWDEVLEKIPAEHRHGAYVTNLALYFGHHGDIPKIIRQCHEQLIQVVGNKAHEEALQHVEFRMTLVTKLMEHSKS